MSDLHRTTSRLADRQLRRLGLETGLRLLQIGIALRSEGRAAARTELGRYAGQNPLRYLAGAAALGFVAVRAGTETLKR